MSRDVTRMYDPGWHTCEACGLTDKDVKPHEDGHMHCVDEERCRRMMRELMARHVSENVRKLGKTEGQ